MFPDKPQQLPWPSKPKKYTPRASSSPAIFIPTLTPAFLVPRAELTLAATLTGRRSTDSWQDMQPESGDDNVIQSSSSWLRHKLKGKSRENPKLISTKAGERGAGETETEADEPPRHLPTSRAIPSSGPLIPPNRLAPLLFEFSRLLSVVPALVGILYLTYHIYNPPDPTVLIDGRRPPERVDFLVSALWALLTGYQCLHLTTGLLARWRVYYPPLATLIRLVSLQAICWPATHLTLSLLEHEKRPVIVWALIGSTTCASRSVQIWATSNLWWEGTGAPVGVGSNVGWDWQWLKGGQWGGRRWDWNDVAKKCMLPAGFLYCVMAWAEQLRREWSGC